MTVRIIQEGPSEFHYEFTCANCQSQLEASADDVQATTFDESDYGYFVDCPRCQPYEGLHRLDATIIPALVRQQADQRRNRST